MGVHCHYVIYPHALEEIGDHACHDRLSTTALIPSAITEEGYDRHKSGSAVPVASICKR
jgi:hypothetical protein